MQCNAANDQAKPPVPPAAAAAAEAPPPSSRLTRLLNWRAGADEAAGEVRRRRVGLLDWRKRHMLMMSSAALTHSLHTLRRPVDSSSRQQ